MRNKFFFVGRYNKFIFFRLFGRSCDVRVRVDASFSALIDQNVTQFRRRSDTSDTTTAFQPPIDRTSDRKLFFD